MKLPRFSEPEITITDPVVEDVPGYRLIQELGNGACGRVWSAVELATGQRVALKFFDLDPECLQGLRPDEARAVRARMRERFEREALIGSWFDGVPGLLRVQAPKKTEHQQPFLVMELLDARQGWEPLDRRLGAWPWLPEEEVQAMAVQLTSALDAMHSAGVEHRDLKPSNVMVRGYGRDVEVKLVDYGIALGHSLPRLTVGCEAPGTPQYLSPTALCGNNDPARDLYALGVVLYEALTGRLPQEGASAAQLLITKQRSAPPVRALRPELDAPFAALVDGLLSQHIACVADLVEALLQAVPTTPINYAE